MQFNFSSISPEEELQAEPIAYDFSSPLGIVGADKWRNASVEERVSAAPEAFLRMTQELEADKSRKIPITQEDGTVKESPLFYPNGDWTIDGRDYLEKSRSFLELAARHETGGAIVDPIENKAFFADDLGSFFTKAKKAKETDLFPELPSYMEDRNALVKEGESGAGNYKDYVDFVNSTIKDPNAHLDPENKEMESKFNSALALASFDPSQMGEDEMIRNVGGKLIMNPKNFSEIDKMEEAIKSQDISVSDKKMMLIDYRKKVEENFGKFAVQFSAADSGVIFGIFDRPLLDELQKGMEDPNFSGYEWVKKNKDRLSKDSYGLGSELASKFRDAIMATGTGALFLASGGQYTSPAEAWGAFGEETSAAYGNQKAFDIFGVEIYRRDLTELTGQIGSFVAMGGLGSLAGKGLLKAGATGASRYAVIEGAAGGASKMVLKSSLNVTEKAAEALLPKTFNQKTLGVLKKAFTDPEVYLGSLQAAGTSYGKTFTQEFERTGNREEAAKAAGIESISDGLGAFIATAVMNRVAPGMGKALGMGDGAVGGGIVQNIKNKALSRQSMDDVKTIISNLGGEGGEALRKQFSLDLGKVMNTSARTLGLKGAGVFGNVGAEAVEETSDEIISDVISSMLDDSKTWDESVWQNIGTKWKEYVKAGVLGAIGGAMGDVSGAVLNPNQTFGTSEGLEIQKAAWDRLKTQVKSFDSLDRFAFDGTLGEAKSVAEYIAMPDSEVSLERKSAALVAAARNGFQYAFTRAVNPAATAAATPAGASATTPSATPSAATGEAQTSYPEGTVGYTMEMAGIPSPDGRSWSKDIGVHDEASVVGSGSKKGDSVTFIPVSVDARTTESGTSQGAVPNVAAKVVTMSGGKVVSTEYLSPAKAAEFLRKDTRFKGNESLAQAFDDRLKQDTEIEYNEWSNQETRGSAQAPSSTPQKASAEATPAAGVEPTPSAESATPTPVEKVKAPGKIGGTQLNKRSSAVKAAAQKITDSGANIDFATSREDAANRFGLEGNTLNRKTVPHARAYRKADGTTGIIIFPAGLKLSDSDLVTLINHERIHLEQYEFEQTAEGELTAKTAEATFDKNDKENYDEEFDRLMRKEYPSWDKLSPRSKVREAARAAVEASLNGQTSHFKPGFFSYLKAFLKHLELVFSNDSEMSKYINAIKSAISKSPAAKETAQTQNKNDNENKNGNDANANGQADGQTNDQANDQGKADGQEEGKADSQEQGNEVKENEAGDKQSPASFIRSTLELDYDLKVNDKEPLKANTSLYNSDRGVFIKRSSPDTVIVTDEAIAEELEKANGDEGAAMEAILERIETLRGTPLQALSVKDSSTAASLVDQEITYVVNPNILSGSENKGVDELGGKWVTYKSNKAPEVSFDEEPAPAKVIYSYTPPTGSTLSLSIGNVVAIDGNENEVLLLERAFDGTWEFSKISLRDAKFDLVNNRGLINQSNKWQRSRLAAIAEEFKASFPNIVSGNITEPQMKTLLDKVLKIVSPQTTFKVTETTDKNSSAIQADPLSDSIVVNYKKLIAEFGGLFETANVSNDFSNTLLGMDAARVMATILDEEISHLIGFKIFERKEVLAFYDSIYSLGKQKLKEGEKQSPIYQMLLETIEERYPGQKLSASPSARKRDADGNLINSVGNTKDAKYKIASELMRKLHQLATSGTTTERATDQARMLQRAIFQDEGSTKGPLKVIAQMLRRYTERIRNILWMKWQQGMLPPTARKMLAELNAAYRKAGIKGDVDYGYDAAKEESMQRSMSYDEMFRRETEKIGRENSDDLIQLREITKRFKNISLEEALVPNRDDMTLELNPTIRDYIERNNLMDMKNVDEVLAKLNGRIDETRSFSPSYQKAMTSAFFKRQMMELRRDELSIDPNNLFDQMKSESNGDLSHLGLWIDLLQGMPQEQIALDEMMSPVALMKEQQYAEMEQTKQLIGKQAIEAVRAIDATDVKSLGRLLKWGRLAQVKIPWNERISRDPRVMEDTILPQLGGGVTVLNWGQGTNAFDPVDETIVDPEIIRSETDNRGSSRVAIASIDTTRLSREEIIANAEPGEILAMLQQYKDSILQSLLLSMPFVNGSSYAEFANEKIGPLEDLAKLKKQEEEYNNTVNNIQALRDAGQKVLERAELEADLDAKVKGIKDRKANFPRRRRNNVLSGAPVSEEAQAKAAALYNQYIAFSKSVDEYNDALKYAINRSLGDFEVTSRNFGLNWTNMNISEGEGDALQYKDQSSILKPATNPNDVFGGPIKEEGMLYGYSSSFRYPKKDADGNDLPLSEKDIKWNAELAIFRKAMKSNANFIGKASFKDFWIETQIGLIRSVGPSENYEFTGGFNFDKIINDSERELFESPEEAFPNLKTNDLNSSIRSMVNDNSDQSLRQLIKFLNNANEWSKLIRSKYQEGAITTIGTKQTLAGRMMPMLDSLFSRVEIFETEASLTNGFDNDLKNFLGHVLSILGKHIQTSSALPMGEVYDLSFNFKTDENGNLIKTSKATYQQIGKELSEFIYQTGLGTLTKSRYNDFAVSLRNATEGVSLVRRTFRGFQNKDWKMNVELEGSLVMRDPAYIPDNMDMIELRKNVSDSRILGNLGWAIEYFELAKDYVFGENFAFEALEEINQSSYGEGREPYIRVNRSGEVEGNEQVIDPNEYSGSEDDPRVANSSMGNRSTVRDWTSTYNEGRASTPQESAERAFGRPAVSRAIKLTKWALFIGSNTAEGRNSKAGKQFYFDMMKAERDSGWFNAEDVIAERARVGAGAFGPSTEAEINAMEAGELKRYFSRVMNENLLRRGLKGIFPGFIAVNSESWETAVYEAFLSEYGNTNGNLEDGLVYEFLDSEKFLTDLLEFKSKFEKKIVDRARVRNGDDIVAAMRTVLAATDEPFEEFQTIYQEVKRATGKELPLSGDYAKSSKRPNNFVSPEDARAIAGLIHKNFISEKFELSDARLEVGAGTGNAVIDHLIQSLPGQTKILRVPIKQLTKAGIKDDGVKVFQGDNNTPNVIFIPLNQSGPIVSGDRANGVIAQLLRITAEGNPKAKQTINEMADKIYDALDPIKFVDHIYSRYIEASVYEDSNEIDPIDQNKDFNRYLFLSSTIDAKAIYQAFLVHFRNLDEHDRRAFTKKLVNHFTDVSEKMRDLKFILDRASIQSIFPGVDSDLGSNIVLLSEILSNEEAKTFLDNAYSDTDIVLDTRLHPGIERQIHDAIRNIRKQKMNESGQFGDEADRAFENTGFAKSNEELILEEQERIRLGGVSRIQRDQISETEELSDEEIKSGEYTMSNPSPSGFRFNELEGSDAFLFNGIATIIESSKLMNGEISDETKQFLRDKMERERNSARRILETYRSSGERENTDVSRAGALVQSPQMRAIRLERAKGVDPMEEANIIYVGEARNLTMPKVGGSTALNLAFRDSRIRNINAAMLHRVPSIEALINNAAREAIVSKLAEKAAVNKQSSYKEPLDQLGFSRQNIKVVLNDSLLDELERLLPEGVIASAKADVLSSIANLESSKTTHEETLFRLKESREALLVENSENIRRNWKGTASDFNPDERSPGKVKKKVVENLLRQPGEEQDQIITIPVKGKKLGLMTAEEAADYDRKLSAVFVDDLNKIDRSIARVERNLVEINNELIDINEHPTFSRVGRTYFRGKIGLDEIRDENRGIVTSDAVPASLRSVGVNLSLVAPYGDNDVVSDEERRNHYVREQTVMTALTKLAEENIEDAYKLVRNTGENFLEFNPLRVIQQAVDLSEVENIVLKERMEMARTDAEIAQQRGMSIEAIAMLTDPLSSGMELLSVGQQKRVKILNMPKSLDQRRLKIGKLFRQDGEALVMMPTTAREQLMQAFPTKVTKRNVKSVTSHVALSAVALSGGALPANRSYFLGSMDDIKGETFNGDDFSLTKGKVLTNEEAAEIFSDEFKTKIQDFLNESRNDGDISGNKKVDLSGPVAKAHIAQYTEMIKQLVMAYNDDGNLLSNATKKEIKALLDGISRDGMDSFTNIVLGAGSFSASAMLNFRVEKVFAKVFSEVEGELIEQRLVSGMTIHDDATSLWVMKYLHHQDARIRNRFRKNYGARQTARHLNAILEYGMDGKSGRQGYLTAKKEAETTIADSAKKVGSNALDHTIGYLHAILEGLNNANGMSYSEAYNAWATELVNGFNQLDALVTQQKIHYGDGLATNKSILNVKNTLKAGFNDFSRYWNASHLDLVRDQELSKELRKIIKSSISGSALVKSGDEAGARQRVEAIQKRLLAAVSKGKESSVLDYSNTLQSVLGDIDSAMHFSMAMASKPADESLTTGEVRSRWKHNQVNAQKKTFSSVPMRSGYAGHPDSKRARREGSYVSDPIDIVSMDGASFFGGIGRTGTIYDDKTVFRPIAINGLTAPLSLVDDSLYRLNITPTYEILRRSIGKVSNPHGIMTVEDGDILTKIEGSLPPQGTMTYAQYRKIKADHGRRIVDLKTVLASVSNELENTIQNDSQIGVVNTGGSEVLRFLGSLYIVRSLASVQQLWDQTSGPSIGYTAGKIAAGKPKMAATYFKIIGKLLSSSKFRKQTREFIRNVSPVVFNRAAEGQDVVKDVSRGQLRYGTSAVKSRSGQALKKYEKLGEGALNLTIGLGERILATSVFLTELMDQMNGMDLDTLLSYSSRPNDIPIMAKTNAQVKVNDMMAQSDQAKKSWVFQTRDSNPAMSALWRSAGRFSNHTASMASNMTVMMPMTLNPLLHSIRPQKFEKIDAESQKEALENVVTTLVQNILFAPFKLKTLVPILSYIIAKAFLTDDDDEAVRKAQEMANTLMAPNEEDGNGLTNLIKVLAFGKKRELFQERLDPDAAFASGIAEILSKTALEFATTIPVIGVAAGYSPISGPTQNLVTNGFAEQTMSLVSGVPVQQAWYEKDGIGIRQYDGTWAENLANITAPTSAAYDMVQASALLASYNTTESAGDDRLQSTLNSALYALSETVPFLRDMRTYMKDRLKDAVKEEE